MDPIEFLSLAAGIMTTGAPITQAMKTWRSGDYAGLSIGSYLLLLCLGTFAVLIGLQYQILSMTLLNAMGLSANLLIMFMISRKALAAYVLVLFGFVLASFLIVPSFVPTLLTTRWAEQVAFVYGLVAAATFLPQVLLTHRTWEVSALSIFNLLLFAGGMLIWIYVSYLLGNYSLTFWNVILLLMLLELVRLKLVIGARNMTVSAGEGPAHTASDMSGPVA